MRGSPYAGARTAGALIGVAAVALLWTRLIGLDRSLAHIELVAVTRYIEPGPEAIFSNGQWIPGNHMLFELLAWITAEVTGWRTEPAYRFWAVAPAIAGVVALTWWLARRFGPWPAAVFAILAAIAPVHLTYGTQARGYGLGFLCAALLVIGADGFKRTGSGPRQAMFTVAAVVGIWALPTFALLVAGFAAAMAASPPLRRAAFETLGVIACAAFIFYAPVIRALVGDADRAAGEPLPWHGFATGALDDLAVPGFALLAPAAPEWPFGLLAAALMVAGAVVLWLARERLLATALLGAPILTYLILEVARLDMAPRFASFLLLPMLALAALGAAAGLERLGPAGAVVLAAFALFGAYKVVDLAGAERARPAENPRGAAEIAERAEPRSAIVSNSGRPLGLEYYLSRPFRALGPGELEAMFCELEPLVYVEDGGHAPLADTACLRERGAVRVGVAHRGDHPLAVWLATRPR